MLTTRQLVDMMEDPCAAGIAFADAHPDPEEAISYALAHAERDPMRTDAVGFRYRDTGTFLRWAASEDVVVGASGVYDGLGYWDRDLEGHLEGCARILREWVAKVQAEHAEVQRAVYAVQQALEAQCIGGEPVRVFPAGPRTTEVRS
jgi:hypothetical protein